MARKRIYLAYTGGTIGMQPSSEGYVPRPGYLAQALAAMPELDRLEMPEVELGEYQPLIDSSNMTPANWQQIADDIARRYAEFDGFVVLHGTDTMAFTAAALAFMFEDLDKPVILTGSQIPLAQLRSDGRENLLNSLYVAAHYPIPEVGLFFNNRLLRGCRATKADAEGFEAFASPNFPPLLDAGIRIRTGAGVVSPGCQRRVKVQPINAQPIGVISLYPGISAAVIRNAVQQPVKALILRSYGVGNAPQAPDFLDALAEASARGIVVVNLTQCLRGSVNMGGYATGHGLRQRGVISGGDMTLEATLAKLHYLLSQQLPADEIRAACERSLRGEISI